MDKDGRGVRQIFTQIGGGLLDFVARVAKDEGLANLRATTGAQRKRAHQIAQAVHGIEGGVELAGGPVLDNGMGTFIIAIAQITLGNANRIGDRGGKGDSL